MVLKSQKNWKWEVNWAVDFTNDYTDGFYYTPINLHTAQRTSKSFHFIVLLSRSSHSNSVYTSHVKYCISVGVGRSKNACTPIHNSLFSLSVHLATFLIQTPTNIYSSLESYWSAFTVFLSFESSYSKSSLFPLQLHIYRISVTFASFLRYWNAICRFVKVIFEQYNQH